MFILYLLIFSFVILLYLIVENKMFILKNLSIISLVSGTFILLIGYVIKLIITMNIRFINISKINNLIFNKFLINSIVFISIGIVLFLIYKIIERKNIKIKST